MVTEKIPGIHSVTVGFWVGVGSRDEQPGEAGITHFLEHLLFKGTESRSALQIAQEMDVVGGDMNAFTSKEHTCYYTRTRDEDLDIALDLLTDITCRPAFPENEIETERGVILEEIRGHEDDPVDLAHEAFYRALWPDSQLGASTLGDEAVITGATREEIRSFYTENYRPADLVVAAAGNVAHERIVEAAEAAFSSLEGRRRPRTPVREVVDSRVAVVSRPTEQAHIVIGTYGLSSTDPDRYALGVLNHVLGGGMSSRLFQEVREKRGLAYSVYSFRSFYEETGSIGVYVGTMPGKVEEVFEIVGAELERAASGIDRSELDRAKGHLKGSLALANEDSGSAMSRLGRGELIEGELLTISDLVARVDAVGLDDVARVAGRVLGRPERIVAVVGPFDDDAFDGLVG